MSLKESEAVPEGNGPSPSKKTSGLVNPRWRMYTDFLKKDSIDSTKYWTAVSIDRRKCWMKSSWMKSSSLEHDARQSRLAMEVDGPANTKTRERTEGAATAVQAMSGDSFSARRVAPDPKTNSISVGMMTEPPALPCRDDILVENGDVSPKPCFPILEMR